MNNTHPPVVYFPDGRVCPPLLTPEEAIMLLRIDCIDVQHPQDTLRRYREAGMLRATRIGLKLFFSLKELLDFIDRQAEGIK